MPSSALASTLWRRPNWNICAQAPLCGTPNVSPLIVGDQRHSRAEIGSPLSDLPWSAPGAQVSACADVDRSSEIPLAIQIW